MMLGSALTTFHRITYGGGLGPSPFNIVIAGRAARTSTHNLPSRIRRLEAVLLCDRIEIGRANISTHIESPGDEGHEETVTDVITLDKDHRRIEHLGLTLAEAKQLLSTLQRHLLQHQ